MSETAARALSEVVHRPLLGRGGVERSLCGTCFVKSITVKVVNGLKVDYGDGWKADVKGK